jgi:hypothetical protein
MSVSLLATKLHFPQVRSNLVPRPRLMTILEKGLRGPLTLISAPAGSGKTTLTGEWRETAMNQIPVAWLSLDSADNDPLRFLTYLTASIKSASPNLTHPTVDLLQASEPPALEVITSSLIESLDAFAVELVLALDDYHVITNIAIHEILNNLLAHLPPALHLVILTRADPPLRSPCKAVIAATGTAAACSNVRLAGFSVIAFSLAHTYSAKVPRPVALGKYPKTSSPGLYCLTLLPVASTRPATSPLGWKKPPGIRRIKNGFARIIRQSRELMEAA